MIGVATPIPASSQFRSGRWRQLFLHDSINLNKINIGDDIESIEDVMTTQSASCILLLIELNLAVASLPHKLTLVHTCPRNLSKLRT